MTSPPQYQKIGEESTENQPLFSPTDEERFLYPPPGNPVASSSTPITNPQDLKRVLYKFRPRYPVPGKDEDVIGVLGRTQEVCHHMMWFPQKDFAAHVTYGRKPSK